MKIQNGAGVCRFCGQSRIIEDGAEMTEPQLAEAATMLCQCDSAKEYQAAANRRIISKQRIDELFGDGEYEQPESAINLAKAAVDLVCDRRAKQVVITFKTGLNAKIMRMAKDKIKVVREISETNTFEQ
ncbi:MAG: hypothetical protein OSJ61_20560 [Lachnospiraceae bacterium]|jgi:hypothetical protein|nr:hypothetical protein [Lachnospiraceae bacterium]